jgi:LysM repeat protein
MRKRIQVGWTILILMIISLIVTSCVRPHPDSQNMVEEPTIMPLITQPAFITQVPPSTPEPSSDAQLPEVPANPTQAPIEPTVEPATETTYIVVAGDTLFKIALEFDVAVDDIAEANGIINIDSLEVGQELIIPAPDAGSDTEPLEPVEPIESTEPQESEQETGQGSDGEGAAASDAAQPTPVSASGGVHIVKPGDNLFRIGLQYGCSVDQLSIYNGITNPNRISVGMEIRIPDCNE